MDKEKIDWNAPAFGSGAQKIIDLETPPAEETVVEPAVVEEVVEEVVAPSEEESKVPYSRFKKFHDAAKEAEKEAAYWKQQAESHKQVDEVEQLDGWETHKQLFGDTEESKRAFKLLQQREEALIQNARREALEAVRNERFEEEARVDENVESLDENFEDLSALVGRDLTEKEQSAILDIVDDFTPKDQYGNYAGQLMPFEKAWEIYEMKTQAGKAAKQGQRDNVASVIGTQTQGEPSISEVDKNFDPRNWDAWKKRIN